MSRRIIYIVWPLALIAACTEQPQTIGSNARADAAAFQGTGKTFQLQTWKTGDKVSWESQMKARTQMGQNDYNKVP